MISRNCHLAQLVGLLHGGKAGFRGLCSLNPEGSFFFFSFFPFFFSGLGFGLGLGLGFEPKRSNRETT